MSFVARIRRALGLIAVALALAVFLAFGALAQQGDSGDVCANADDYGECVESWLGACVNYPEAEDICPIG